MSDMTRIVLSLGLICLVSGAALGGLNEGTKERIEIQILENKQMPAVRAVLAGADNDLLADRRPLPLDGGKAKLLFPAKKGGELTGVALEFFGTGFEGPVGVMIGFDAASDKLLGVGITTIAETPGVGMRAKDATFTDQFKGQPLDSVWKVKSDGGAVEAVTGATITSRAVSKALDEGAAFYREHKTEILEAAKASAP